jgi:hypothetical protein
MEHDRQRGREWCVVRQPREVGVDVFQPISVPRRVGPEMREQTAFAKKPPADVTGGVGEDAFEFFADALWCNPPELRRVQLNGREGGRLERKAEAGREAHGAQQAQVIFAKAFAGLTDGADQSGLQIGAGRGTCR